MASSSSGGGTFGAVALVLEALLGRLERRRADEDLLAVLDRHHAPRREAAAVAAAIDAVDDGLGEIAAPQKIRVHRMHDAPVVDGGMRRHQRLAQHLPAEHLRTARIAALAAKQVHLEPLELELLLEIGEAAGSSTQPNLNAPFMSASGRGRCRRTLYASPFLSSRRREFHRRRLAATDDLGVRNHARVALLDVVVGNTGGDAVAGDRLRRRRSSASTQLWPMACRRQLAGVRERDFDFGAVGGDGNFLLVELSSGRCRRYRPCRPCRRRRRCGAASDQGQTGNRADRISSWTPLRS